MSCVDQYYVFCISMQIVQLSAKKSLAVVKTKMESGSHADTCVGGDHYQAVNDHNRPVNIYEHDPKAGSKHAHSQCHCHL